MQPSSTLCRAQEMFHRKRAADATLINVRTVAEKAAAAWGAEAILAEKRQDRQQQASAFRASGAANLSEEDEDEDDLSFSENPDRGLAG